MGARSLYFLSLVGVYNYGKNTNVLLTMSFVMMVDTNKSDCCL